MKFKSNNNAVTELFGSMILLVIAVSVLMFVYSDVFSNLESPEKINVDLFGTVNEGLSAIVIEHKGGDSLGIDTYINIDDSSDTDSFTLANIKNGEVDATLVSADGTSNGLDNNQWNIGERLIYPIDSVTQNYLIKVGDQPTNRLVMVGTIQVPFINPFWWGSYALFSNSGLEVEKGVDWSGQDNTIFGDIHANGGLYIATKPNTINGDITYVTNIHIEDGNTYDSESQTSSQSFPLNYNFSDYEPGGIEAVKADSEGKYYYINGDYIPPNDNYEIPEGLYYVTGKVDLSKNFLTGNVTFVAQGEIIIGGNNNIFRTYCNDLLFFTPNLFKLSGNDNTLYGITYVPNSHIELSGSNNIIYGGFYSDTIKMNGNYYEIYPL